MYIIKGHYLPLHHDEDLVVFLTVPLDIRYAFKALIQSKDFRAQTLKTDPKCGLAASSQ